MQKTYCVVYTTVHSIQYENGWAYTACKSCNSRVSAISTEGTNYSKHKKQLWYCKKHGETYTAASRYSLYFLKHIKLISHINQIKKIPY
jgi:uncharacterized protein with PIN domain